MFACGVGREGSQIMSARACLTWQLFYQLTHTHTRSLLLYRAHSTTRAHTLHPPHAHPLDMGVFERGLFISLHEVRPRLPSAPLSKPPGFPQP